MEPFVLLSPAFQRWSLKFDGEDWLIPSFMDAMTLCGYLPIRISEADGVMPVLPRGKISVTEIHSMRCQIAFRNMLDKPNVRENVELPVARISTGAIIWEEGLYEDGWTDVIVKASIENVSEISIKAYLPPSNISEDKPVNVYIGDELIETFILHRGDVSELHLKDILEKSAHLLRFESLFPEASIGSNDKRELGFVLTEININDSGWHAAFI